MKIVVDTTEDITQLFKLISETVKKLDKNSDIILENYIYITYTEKNVSKEVADVIADFIIDFYEEKIAVKFIKAFELLKNETDEILSLFSNDNELKQKRKSILKKEVLSALKKRHINVDGLIKFRLFEYKKELQFTVDLLVDEYTTKKSYDEFIDLMKYFAEIQTPVTDTVVISEDGGEYKLTDSFGNLINLKFDEEFADELMPLNLTDEDLLISNLMAAMPKKIVFNNINAEKPVINTISRIFEGRITH